MNRNVQGQCSHVKNFRANSIDTHCLTWVQIDKRGMNINIRNVSIVGVAEGSEDLLN